MNAPITTGPREASVPVAKRPLRQVANVRELLVNDQAKQQLAAVAAAHMRPEQMLRLMANAIRTTPQLADCDPLSLLGCMMTCASLGLMPNTPLQSAYLIPFKSKRKGVTEVQLVVGYRGMIDLARRSGHIRNIHGDVVYEGDEFSFEYGSNQHLKHRPKGKRVNPVYAYCHATLTDGEAFVVLPWDEVMAIRDASQVYRTAVQYGKKDAPWIAHEHAMASKTAVRALFKSLPISIELDNGKLGDALTVDENQIDFSSFATNPEDGPAIDGEVVDEGTGEVYQVEDQRAGQMTMDRETDPAPAQRREKRDAEVAPDYTDPKPHSQRQQRGNRGGAQKGISFDAQPSLSERIQMISDSINDALAEGVPLDETLEMFDAQLAQIRDEDADEYEAMIEDFKAFAARLDGGTSA